MAVHLRADGTKAELLPATGREFTLSELRAAIGGGSVELVRLSDGRLMVCDGDYLAKELPFNEAATALLAPSHGDYPVLGDVVVGSRFEIT